MVEKPSGAYVGASWAGLAAGVLAYCIGLWNADIDIASKGFYLTVLLYGLFAAVSVQKSVRDRNEGIQVTNIYYGICWVAVVSALLLLTVGLFNASLALSEKGFYAMAFLLALFCAITIQKNTRDIGAPWPGDVLRPRRAPTE